MKHIIHVDNSDDEAQYKRLEAMGVKAIIQKSGDWKSELGKILG